MKDKQQTIDPVALNYQDAAHYLSVSPTTIRRLVNEGQLHQVKIGRRIVFRVSDLNALLDSGMDIKT